MFNFMRKCIECTTSRLNFFSSRHVSQVFIIYIQKLCLYFKWKCLFSSRVFSYINRIKTILPGIVRFIITCSVSKDLKHYYFKNFKDSFLQSYTSVKITIISSKTTFLLLRRKIVIFVTQFIHIQATSTYFEQPNPYTSIVHIKKFYPTYKERIVGAISVNNTIAYLPIR